MGFTRAVKTLQLTRGTRDLPLREGITCLAQPVTFPPSSLPDLLPCLYLPLDLTAHFPLPFSCHFVT